MKVYQDMKAKEFKIKTCSECGTNRDKLVNKILGIMKHPEAKP